MWYPNDVERLAALSDHVSRWVLGWARRHWRRLCIQTDAREGNRSPVQ